MKKDDLLSIIKRFKEEGGSFDELKEYWQKLDKESILDSLNKENLIIDRLKDKYLGKVINLDPQSYLLVQKVYISTSYENKYLVHLIGPKVSHKIKSNHLFISLEQSCPFGETRFGGEIRTIIEIDENNELLFNKEYEIVDYELFKSYLSQLSDNIRDFTDSLEDYFYEECIIK